MQNSPLHRIHSGSFSFLVRVSLSLLVLSLTLQTELAAAPKQPFDAFDSSFEGEDRALIWTARFRDPQDSHPAPYLVRRAYGSRALRAAAEAGAKLLFETELALPDGKRASLRFRRRSAPHSDPGKRLFTYDLEVGKRLSVHREIPVAVNGDEPAGLDDTRILGELEGDPGRVARALMAKDTSDLEGTRLFQLVVWLLSTERPLGPSSKRLVLQKCRAEIAGKNLELPISRNTVGTAILRLPANAGQSITLRPVIQIREFTAYSNTVVIKQRPLPAYALVKVTQRGSSLRRFAQAATPPGTFELGPFQPKTVRGIEMVAAFPLEPPGEHPRLRAELLFRNGRPIEAFLDRGELPPPPRVPRALPSNGVVNFVVRMAEAAINPDTGEIRGVAYRDLVDLYAIAFERMRQHPELHRVAEQALLKDIARRSWTYPRRELSPGSGWTAQDAQIVLTYPSLADQLAGKLREETEPRDWTATKGGRPARKEPDTVSAAPHALAAAGLAKSKEHSGLVMSQLQHLRQHHRLDHPEKLSLAELVESGQPLKIVAEQGADASTRRLAGSLLRALRREAHRRFVGRSELALSDRIALAHLISGVWRPYLKAPARLLVDSMEIEPAGGEANRDFSLQELQRRYRAALLREANELLPRRLSDSEKTQRLDALAERWLAYIQRRQGQLPPDFRRDLDEARRRALQELTRP